jgi:hypothetical protein
MSRGVIAALAAVLAGASVALGQAASLSPPVAPLPPPAIVASPGGETAPLLPPDLGPGPCLDGHAGQDRGYFALDADAFIGLLYTNHSTTRIGATRPLDPMGFNITNTLGEEHLHRHTEPGGRFTLSYWLTEPNPWVPGGVMQDLGGEVRVFFMGGRSVSATVDRTPTLVRPFFDLNNNMESGIIVAAPGLASGSLTGAASARLWGGEANVWKNLTYEQPGTTYIVDGMVGMRFLSLDENAEVIRSSLFFANPNFTALQAVFPNIDIASVAGFAGNRINERESVSIHNRFYGAQAGIRGRFYPTPQLIVTAEAKLALGVTSEEINIQGNQARTFANGQTVVSQGALLALPSNIGLFHLDKFASVPEVGINVAYPVTKCLTVSIGFNALYWSRFARAGDQFDRVVDISQIPNPVFPFPPANTAPTGERRPAASFTQAEVWFLSALVSAEFKW